MLLCTITYIYDGFKTLTILPVIIIWQDDDRVYCDTDRERVNTHNIDYAMEY